MGEKKEREVDWEVLMFCYSLQPHSLLCTKDQYQDLFQQKKKEVF